MATGLMPQKDRLELRRIMKARFELLREQLMQREQQFKIKIQEELEAQHASIVKEAQKRTDALRKKAEKLEAEAQDYGAKMQAKAKALMEEAQELQEEMENQGVVPYVRHGRHHNQEQDVLAISVSCHVEPYAIDRWTPKNLSQKVQAAYQRLAAEAGLHSIDLRMQELELSEQLAIGALASDEAKKFLGTIPNIDNLLPAPNGNVAELIAGSTEEVK